MQTAYPALPSGAPGWPAQGSLESPRDAYNSNAAAGGQESDISFRDIASMLWRRRFANFIIVSSFVGAAILVSLLMHKKYQATSEMIVLQAASPQQSLATPNNSPPSLLSGVTTPLIETPDTQVAMISSPGMAQRTIDYLKNAALKQHKTLADLGLDLDPDTLMNNILVVNPKGTNLLEVSVTASTPEASRILTNAVSEAFVQWKREVAQASVDEMTRNLDVRAERAHAAMLNAERRTTDFQKRWSVVDIPEQEKASLAQLLARQGDVAALQQEVAAHQVRLAGLTAQLDQANREIGSPGGVRDDLLVSGLQQQLSQAQMDLAAAQRKYTSAYPGILPDLQAHVSELKSRLDRAVGSAVHGNASLQSQGALKELVQQEQVAFAYVQNKLLAATAQRDKLNSETTKWPDLHNKYQRLANESDMARTLYAMLESQVSAAHSGKDMTTGNVQVTQVALLPDEPYSPKIPLNIALGLVLGLIVATVITLIKSQADRRIYTVEDAIKLMSGPSVGSVPALSNTERHELTNDKSDGYLRDAFGLAAANLMLLCQGTESDRVERFQSSNSDMESTRNAARGHIILVTSALPGEGKSTVAAELAKAIARSSRSVILLDADLRRPTQHHLFKSEVTAGLSNVLAQTATLDSVISATDTANLQFVHSGSAESGQSTNPTGLLSQPLMREVLKTLSEGVDVVIIDTPPSAIVPDALFLAPYADCVLQVIGIGDSDSDAVRESTLAFYGATPGAVVYLINRAPRNRSRRNNYQIAYGKGALAGHIDKSRPRASEISSDLVPVSNARKDV